MAMTLKQAFTLWANAPRNMVLAARSRDAVQRVLMRKWSDTDLKDITSVFAARMFALSHENMEMKTKAASILVHLLQWGGDHGHCPRPSFDYTIANTDTLDDPVKEMPSLSATTAAASPQDAADPLAGVDFPSGDDESKQETIEQPGQRPESHLGDADSRHGSTKNQTDMEKRNVAGRPPKHVVQIDPVTMKPVREWESRSAAERELGITNIERHVRSRRMAGGFYWCGPDDVESFKPSEQPASEPRKFKRVAPRFRSDDTLPVRNKVAKQALEVFTDQELKDELVRRGWRGHLQRMQKMDLDDNQTATV